MNRRGFIVFGALAPLAPTSVWSSGEEPVGTLTLTPSYMPYPLIRFMWDGTTSKADFLKKCFFVPEGCENTTVHLHGATPCCRVTFAHPYEMPTEDLYCTECGRALVKWEIASL